MYATQYAEDCSEVQFTAPIIYAIAAVFAVIAIVATITIYLTFKYKKQYYQLLGDEEESVELKQIGKIRDITVLASDKKLEVHSE